MSENNTLNTFPKIDKSKNKTANFRLGYRCRNWATLYQLHLTNFIKVALSNNLPMKDSKESSYRGEMNG